MRASMVLFWQAGQSGRMDVAGWIMCFALDQAGALQNSQSPVDTDTGAVMTNSLPRRVPTYWSLQTTSRKN
jgi:hypothetical protein